SGRSVRNRGVTSAASSTMHSMTGSTWRWPAGRRRESVALGMAAGESFMPRAAGPSRDGQGCARPSVSALLRVHHVVLLDNVPAKLAFGRLALGDVHVHLRVHLAGDHLGP